MEDEYYFLQFYNFFSNLKSEIDFHFPRVEFFRMREITLIVFGEARLQICHQTDITLTRKGKKPGVCRCKT